MLSTNPFTQSQGYDQRQQKSASPNRLSSFFSKTNSKKPTTSSTTTTTTHNPYNNELLLILSDERARLSPYIFCKKVILSLEKYSQVDDPLFQTNLYNFLPHLCVRLFGSPLSGPGILNNCHLSEDDKRYVNRLLAPDGPLVRALLKFTSPNSEPLFFEVNVDKLPLHTQSLLRSMDLSNLEAALPFLPPVYAKRIVASQYQHSQFPQTTTTFPSMSSSTMPIMMPPPGKTDLKIVLNMFEYYMFSFAYFVNQFQVASSTSSSSSSSTSSTSSLAASTSGLANSTTASSKSSWNTLFHPSSSMSSSQSAIAKQMTRYVNPNSYSAYFDTLDRYLDYFLPAGRLVHLPMTTQPRPTNTINVFTDMTLDPNARRYAASEFLFEAFSELWMSPQHESIPLLANTTVHYAPPSLLLLDVVQTLVHHCSTLSNAVIFSSVSGMETDQLGLEIRSLAYRVMGPKLYEFLKWGFSTCEENCFSQIVEIWLDYISPWSVNSDPASSPFRNRTSSAIIVIDYNIWEPFIADHFLLYTQSWRPFLERIGVLDFQAFRQGTTSSSSVSVSRQQKLAVSPHLETLETVLRYFTHTQDLVEKIIYFEKIFLEEIRGGQTSFVSTTPAPATSLLSSFSGAQPLAIGMANSANQRILARKIKFVVEIFESMSSNPLVQQQQRMMGMSSLSESYRPMFVFSSERDFVLGKGNTVEVLDKLVRKLAHIYHDLDTQRISIESTLKHSSPSDKSSTTRRHRERSTSSSASLSMQSPLLRKRSLLTSQQQSPKTPCPSSSSSSLVQSSQRKQSSNDDGQKDLLAFLETDKKNEKGVKLKQEETVTQPESSITIFPPTPSSEAGLSDWMKWFASVLVMIAFVTVRMICQSLGQVFKALNQVKTFITDDSSSSPTHSHSSTTSKTSNINKTQQLSTIRKSLSNFDRVLEMMVTIWSGVGEEFDTMLRELEVQAAVSRFSDSSSSPSFPSLLGKQSLVSTKLKMRGSASAMKNRNGKQKDEIQVRRTERSKKVVMGSEVAWLVKVLTNIADVLSFWHTRFFDFFTETLKAPLPAEYRILPYDEYLRVFAQRQLLVDGLWVLLVMGGMIAFIKFFVDLSTPQYQPHQQTQNSYHRQQYRHY